MSQGSDGYRASLLSAFLQARASEPGRVAVPALFLHQGVISLPVCPRFGFTYTNTHVPIGLKSLRLILSFSLSPAPFQNTPSVPY